MRRGLLAAAPVVTFLVATGRWFPPLPVAGALAGVVLAFLAARRPSLAAPVAVATIAFVPVYWGRGLGGFGVAAIPVTVAGAVLAPAALRCRDRFQVVALDVAVAAYLVLRTASFLLNYRTGAGAAVGYTSRIVAGYAVFRLLGLLPGIRRRLALALVAVAGLLGLLVRFESGGNWFFGALPAGFQASAWARPELRFGAVRVEAGFGHPIPFGLFLALALTLAVALAVTARPRRDAVALVAASGLALLALVDTLSRGPLLVAAGGVVGWALLERRHVSGGRAVIASLVVAALVVFTPALIAVGALWSSSRGDTREARSAEYRVQVAALLADPAQFSLLGRQTDVDGDVSRSVSGRVGFKSLDNEYAIVYLGGGALSLAAFLWVALATLQAALRPALDPVDRAWAMASAAVLLGLLTVALLTQFADLFWIGLALVACAAQEARPATGRKSATATPFPSRVATAALQP